jgi:diaminopimelate decarboxylase
MRNHEAGAVHAEAAFAAPQWLRPPSDVNSLLPQLWARTVTRADDGALRVGGVDVRALAAEVGTPAYVLDEADFRARLREHREAYEGWTVYYAGKAFLCRAVARWAAEEGLSLDVCTGGELSVALSADFPAERIGFHGNNKSTTEIRRAVEAGVGRIIVDSYDEIERVAAAARAAGRQQPVMVRVKVGVEAHTHEFIATAHEDQKFGFSLADGATFEAVRRVLARPEDLELTGLHSHIGSQIFDTQAFEVAARRVVGAHAAIGAEHGIELPEMDLGGGFGIAYSTQDDPLRPAQLAKQLHDIVAHECAAHGVPLPRLSVEPGRAIAGPTTFTLYEVGTVKLVDVAADAVRHYVSVDGGMSDNIRTAMYGATYSCTLANRRSDAPPVLARVVGKHCESGDIVVMDEFLPGDVAPGDLLAVPGTGAYCRSMASNYNHVLRPPVVAVRDGAARVVVRRETEDDLLALDVG